jgi:hypothetical protein
MRKLRRGRIPQINEVISKVLLETSVSWKMLSMSARPARRWEQTRKRGEVFFVLVNGVLGYVGFVFLASTCADVFVRHKQLSASLIVEQAVTWLVAGFAWGVAIWHLQEKQYREGMREES